MSVEEIDLAYGMGAAFTHDAVSVRSHLFPLALLETITSTPPSKLTIARGMGDSMMPTLHDGDMVIIDRSQRTVRDQDAIWALTVGDIAMIKRLRVKSDRVLLLSDNERVPPDEATHDEINIVGRVIFIGRRM
ncbi:S24 family peptidase [Sphingomonas paucimobilis]|uniref:S24 family peptidase n=1 Tax=Sphingomonas paucimobilis TaxID=13689 RepID=UPI001F05DC04|nr:S24 family peptidase [Sphingomonas paucimobilis]